MNIKVKDKDYELKFSYNSFLHLGDFDMSGLEEIQHKPFMLITVTRQLLIGALNFDPKKIVTVEEIDEIMETMLEETNISDLFTDLVKLLEDSSFFKSLQKKPKKK
jgi:hypothetical protein